MSRITSKRQVTLPKAIADEYGIGPGDSIDWVADGDSIRVILPRAERAAPGLTEPTLEERLECFDQATERQRLRQREAGSLPAEDRGWTRDELYDRGVSGRH